jgi:uncharacterized membrane protein
MLRKVNFKFLFATVLSLALINSVELETPNNHWGRWLNISNEAFARSSGGRGGGGSFRGPSNSRPSNSGRSSPRRYDDPGYYRRDPGYGPRGPNVIVVPGGGGYYGGGHSSGFSIFPMLLILGLFGLIALIVISHWLRSAASNSNANGFSDGFASGNNELDNDIVTISKLQVALLAQTTKGLQSQLSDLTLKVDTDTEEGLLELLQESALILLRNSENWSHVLASSQSTNINEAEAIFNQLSLQERSKFSAETLTNVRGKVSQKDAVIPGLEEDPAAYIVVTLLVGTADDHPLLKDVRSPETLKDALQRVASVPPDYLLKFELLWSPQVEADSLTYDELLTEYTDMVQIA